VAFDRFKKVKATANYQVGLQTSGAELSVNLCCFYYRTFTSTSMSVWTITIFLRTKQCTQLLHSCVNQA